MTDRKPGDIFTQGVARMTVLQDAASGQLMTVEIIEAIPLDLIDPSPLNRTEFDEAKQAEMVESLKEHGQTTPGIVRPKAGGRYELVAGERRWRGCKGAGIPTLSAVVRSYTESQAAEILLIENLEREDLKPTEEAKIYQRLLELKDEEGRKLFTLQRIAERVHNDPKKVDRVARVLTILDLPKELKKALDDEKISLRTAFMVARIADEEDRKVAGAAVLKGQYGEGPMTIDKAANYIALNFQVNLKGAKFDRADPDLLPAAVKAQMGHTGAAGEANDGSCERCQWLAKNHPVFSQELSTGGKGKERGLGIDPLTCTRARCHEAKLEAVWQRVAGPFAEKHGAVRILTREESENVVGWNSDWVKLDEKPTHQDTGDWEAAASAPTWQKLIKGAGVPLVVAAHGGGDPELVVDRALAVQAAKAARPDLFVKAKLAGQSSANVVLSEEELERQRQEEFERKVQVAVKERLHREAMLELARSVEEKGLSLEGYRGLFDSISRTVEELNLVAELFVPGAEEWTEEAGRAHLETLSAQGLLALCVVASVIDDAKASGLERAEDFVTIARGQGLDLPALTKAVEKQVRAKLKAEAKAADEEARKKAHTKSRNDMEEIQKRTILEEGKGGEESKPEGVRVGGSNYQVGTGEQMAEELMNAEVPVTTPNENGVFCEPLEVKLRVGKVWVAVRLARSVENLWSTGYAYGGEPIEKVNRGSGLPNVKREWSDRYAAVEDKLAELSHALEGRKPFAALVQELDQARAAVVAAQSRRLLKQECREWRAENPGKATSEMAHALGIDTAVAFDLVDELIDEAYDAKAEAAAASTLEDEVRRILAGESYVDVLGKTPKKGTPEHKEHEKRRVALVRAVKGAQEAT